VAKGKKDQIGTTLIVSIAGWKIEDNIGDND